MTETHLQTAPHRAPAPRFSWFRGAIALLVLGAITFFLGLGGLPLAGPDEPRYSEVAREMFASGDWVTPRLSGYLWFEKPALLYWGQAASYHLLGVNETAARLPSALAALITVLFVAYALARLGWARWGFLAGATLATSVLWFALARAASTDMVLAGTISVAVLSGYLAFNAIGRARWGFWLCFSCALGAAMLAKGLIALILIFGILGIHRLLMRQPIFGTLKRNALILLAGAVVFLLTIAIWYVPVTLANGMVFINEFFVNHHFKRFLTNKYHHQEPPYFYLFVAFVGVLPWSFWIPAAMARLRRLRARDDARGALLLLAWIWAVVPIAFFSLSGSKLPAYILPSFPALAILIGAELERVWNGQADLWSRIALALTAIVVLAIGVGFGVYLWIEKIPLALWQWPLPALVAVVGVATFVLWLRGQKRGVLGGTLALTASLAMAAVLVLFGPLSAKISKKGVAVAAASQLQSGESIVFYRKQKEYAPVFYAQGRVLFYQQVEDAQGEPIAGQGTLLPRGTLSTGDEIDALTVDELMLALDQSPTQSLVVITQTPGATELASQTRLDTKLIAQEGKVMALRVAKR